MDHRRAELPEAVRADGSDSTRVLRIDCADCDHRGSDLCEDCLVTFLCEREDDGAVVVPFEEIRAVRLLQNRGLVPLNRHRSTRVGGGVPDRRDGAAWGDGRTA